MADSKNVTATKKVKESTQDRDYKHLISYASKARQRAYAPYSKFKVGAALLTKNKKIYTGCNIENASFGASLCAERVAFAKAISEGEREFEAIVIVGGKSTEELVSPCGICIQFMSEFADEDFVVVLKNGRHYTNYTISQLLPIGFGKKDLH